MNRNGSNSSSPVVEWLRESLKPRAILNGLITLSWLAPLTILIWIYADRAQVVSVDEVTIPIEVRASGNRFASLELHDKNPVAQLVGPRSRIDQIRPAINPREGQPTVIIPIENLAPGSTYPLDTAQQIMNSPVFQYSGVSVKDCKPAQIRVFVDEFVERELEVQAPPNSNLSNVVFTPAKVMLRAPKSYVDNASRAPVVQADFSAANILNVPGSHNDVTVSVDSPQLQGQAGVTINPSTVKASVEVRPKNETKTLSAVQIYVSVPPASMNTYGITCPASVSSVKVTGPPDQLALLEQNPPRATLVVGRDATGGEPQMATLKFEFPAGAPDVRVESDSIAPVTYRLIPQKPG